MSHRLPLLILPILTATSLAVPVQAKPKPHTPKAPAAAPSVATPPSPAWPFRMAAPESDAPKGPEPGGLGIVLCLFGVALASFSLVMDFESISQAIAYGLPERESWRLGFGLIVTLVWLYLEILRLLAIVSSNSR